MSLGPVKTATIVPGIDAYSAPQYAGTAESGAPDQTVDSLQDMFNQSDPVIPNTADAIAEDPFLALRNAVEGSVYSPNIKVPMLEDLVASDPTLATFADGTVADLFSHLQITIEGYKVNTNAKIKQGLASPAEIHAMQATLKKIDEALLQIDAQLVKVEALAQQARDTYEKEITELLPQALLGNITPEDADLNHDGYIGNPKTTDYVIGYQTIDEERTSAVLLKSTKKPVPFDPKTGIPLQGNVRDPNYAWTIAAHGLTTVANKPTDKKQTKTDLTLAVGAVTGDDGNVFHTPINIAVPEFIWVKADAKHTDRPAKDSDGSYVIKPFDGLTQAAPNAAEQGDWLQIKVTNFTVGSEHQPPINWTGENWTEADGADHILTLKGKDGDTIMKIRIAGRAAKSDPESFVHNGFVAASSVGIAFTAGEGDMARTSPINFSVDDSFLSTGRHYVQGLQNRYDIDPGVAGEGSDDQARKNKGINSMLNIFGTGAETNISGYNRTGLRTGVFVQGLTGNLKGSAYNDFFDIPDLTGDKTKAQYITTVDAGFGYNAVIAGAGDHTILGASFAKVTGNEGDVNLISTPIDLHVKSWDAKGNVVGAPSNPAVYISVHTPGGRTVIGNGTEATGPDGKPLTGQADDAKDDFYDIESGEVSYTNSLDQDIGGGQFAQAAADGATALFSEHYKKIDSFIQEDPTTTEGAIEDGDWDFGSDIYAQAKAEQDAFFEEFEKYYGPASDAEDGDDAETDIGEVFGS